MDRDTKKTLRELYDRTISDARSELERLKLSSEESGKLSSDGKWEDLKPGEIARLEATIAEYETLRTALPA